MTAPRRGVNPADAATVLKALLDVWDLAAERMLIAVTRRLARGITAEGWATLKGREVLAVRDELAGIVQRAELATPALAVRALEEARQIGERAAATLEVDAIRTRTGAVQDLAARLVGQLQGARLPVIRASQDVFQRAILDAEQLMETGTVVRREVVAQVVDRLLAQGVDRFPAADGRRWHLDSYARMAGRTVAGQAAVEGQLDRMVAEGRDLVVISDSPRECAVCRPWEGRVLSITGRSVGEPHVVGTVAAARAAGLWHPNCTHRADQYTPGLTRVSTPDANPGGYEEQQRLRTLERRARELKRRRAAADQFGNTAAGRAIRQRITANSQEIKRLTEASGQLRRRDRERPVG